MFKNLSILLLLALLLGTKSGKGQSSRNLAQVDTLLQKAYALGIFNGNVLIAENGKIIYKNSIGWADAGNTIKLTEDYRFHIGSIAKEFNAVGIMMLQEQGRLSLDDKVSKYLPDLPAWADKIKIRNLLQYTSGIPQTNWREIKGDMDNMQSLKAVASLNFEPGTKYNYNNNDVFLQRRIIEKITGMSYQHFVMEKMFKPCGIKNAVFDAKSTDKLIAESYNDQKTPDDLNYEISGWPLLTLLDFYRWSECINSFHLITPASTQQLIIPFAADNQTGLGHGTMEHNLLVHHQHDGTAKNYQALLISNTTKAITILLMTNNKQGNLGQVANSIQAILEGKPYLQVKRSFVNVFSAQMEKMNGMEIIALYEKIKEEHPDQYNFGSESTLNQVGYFLLNNHKVADAITVFTYNTKLFPTIGNMFDSLAEAYYVQGNKQKALEYYTIALKLDPSLTSAKKMIEELK